MLRKIIPLAIILIGVGLFIWGWARGEALEVFLKASRLCFECMGLGR
jgi:hypothetical protein